MGDLTLDARLRHLEERLGEARTAPITDEIRSLDADVDRNKDFVNALRRDVNGLLRHLGLAFDSAAPFGPLTESGFCGRCGQVFAGAHTEIECDRIRADLARGEVECEIAVDDRLVHGWEFDTHGDFTRAVCACGWESPLYSDEAMVAEHAQAHSEAAQLADRVENAEPVEAVPVHGDPRKALNYTRIFRNDVRTLPMPADGEPELMILGGCDRCGWRCAMPEGAIWPKCPGCGDLVLPPERGPAGSGDHGDVQATVAYWVGEGEAISKMHDHLRELYPERYR